MRLGPPGAAKRVVVGGAHDMHHQKKDPHCPIAYRMGAMLPVKPDGSVASGCNRAAALPTRPARDREDVSTRRPVVAMADIASGKRERWSATLRKNRPAFRSTTGGQGSRIRCTAFRDVGSSPVRSRTLLKQDTKQETPLLCEQARGSQARQCQHLFIACVKSTSLRIHSSQLPRSPITCADGPHGQAAVA